MQQYSALVVGACAHRWEIVVPGQAGSPQMGQRHPVRTQHADVATGQRHVLQVGKPLIPLVVREHDLATPDRAVGTVAGSVECEAEHALRSVQPVFGHHRGDVCVVVLDRPDRSATGIAVRPRGGAVARM